MILLVCILFGSVVLGSPRDESKQTREHLRRVFPEAADIMRNAFHLSAADVESVLQLSTQPWVGDSVEVLTPVANNIPLGYAIVDNVRGRDQPITYLVMVSPELRVKGVEVLAYRESYGREITNSSWLKQFLDKQRLDDLKPGRDIRSITGATISARSVTLGVKKVLSVLHVLKGRLP